MNEYRLTRNEPFLNPNCFGHTDLEVQSGYYMAEREEAIALMQRCFLTTLLGFRQKPDYPAEDLEPDLDDCYRTGQTTTPTSRIIGLPSTGSYQPVGS